MKPTSVVTIIIITSYVYLRTLNAFMSELVIYKKSTQMRIVE